MRRNATAIMVLVVLMATAATLAPVAAADPLAAKQRVTIQLKGAGSFVLAPMTSGAVKRDTGSVSACCWTRRFITRGGLTNEIDDPRVTLRGKRGTLVLRNRIEFSDIPDGWAVFTGTWKIVRGTGAYAGLSGGGHGAGIQLADGSAKALYEGFLTPK
jgi:hypothetical protein